jgi:glycerophosphoryl diester phosphodiesterase
MDLPRISCDAFSSNRPMMRGVLVGMLAILLTATSGCMDSSEAPSEPSESSTSAEAPLRPSGFDLQGHRGARGLVPENTLPAFRRALDLEVTTLELDVVISADSQVVVSHEPWMSATICTQPDGTPVPPDSRQQFNLFEMPYARIAEFDCGRRGHPDFPEQEAMPVVKPLLRDVIQMAEAYADSTSRAPIFYNIETKSQPEGDNTFHPEPEPFTELLYGVLEDEGITRRATIQSFDPRTLRAARAIDASLSLALLVGRDGGDLAGNVEALGFTPTIYSPNYQLVDAEMITAAHGRGMEVIPWTVNERADMERLQQLGVDGLITDYPNRAQFLIEP